MAYERVSDGLILITRLASALRLMFEAWCFALCCVSNNARGAIFLGSLTSELVDSLSVDYRSR